MNPLKILVVKRRAMGDSIIGLSGIAYLKMFFPNAQITYGLPSWIIPLYTNVECGANSFVNIDLKSPLDWFRLWIALSRGKIDLIVELHQSGRTARFFRWYSKIMRVPYFFHNHHSEESLKERSSAIQRDLDGVWRVAKSVSDDEFLPRPSYLDFVPRMCPNQKATRDPFRILLGVVASRKTKIWPLEYFKELSDRLLEWNPNIRINIALSDSPLDREIQEKLIALGILQSGKVEFIKTSLNELPLIVARHTLYVGNDTGIKHLCVSLGVKTITLFGPDGPFEWHPYDCQKEKIFFIPDEQMPCRVKDAHFCGRSECESMRCLRDIKVDPVFEECCRQI